MVTAEQIEEAHERIKDDIHFTPIMTSESIDKLAGCKVFFKCEHLQKTGSFKVRGATNVVRSLNSQCHGVITHSSGNHGQALAWAAAKVGIPCCVVVPRGAPALKLDAMKEYGARLELCDNNVLAREEVCDRMTKELGYEFVPPFNYEAVICGQGTTAKEILEQVPDVEAVFVAVGGGGLASGIATYIGEKRPDVKVILCEPEGKKLSDHLESDKFTGESSLDTVADGIRVGCIGPLCHAALKKYCTWNVITVTEQEIRDAIKLIWTRLKQRVEPAAGVPLAALLKSNITMKCKKVAIVLCGGNVDIDFIP